jgi:hypothetical protein
LEVAVRHLARGRRTVALAAVTVLVSACITFGAIGCSSEEDSGSSEAGDPTSTQQTDTAREEARRERAKLRRERAKIRRERIALREERRAARQRRARRIARAAARRERQQHEIEQAAAAPPPEENCHPSYDPCLDPNASDYDCDGGSGDGPEYTGPVTVKGDDPYDLDSDGDGYACES